jgi:phosphoribosylformylglycinamidine synthase
MLVMRGSLAHSHFRLERWLSKINNVVPQVNTIFAEFVHFVDLEETISKQENELLSNLLTYGAPAIVPAGSPRTLILVVPKLGTISAWSSQATDIAHHCGLKKIRRIERGILYSLDTNEKLTWGDEQAIARLLYHPETESVFYRFQDAGFLFKKTDTPSIVRPNNIEDFLELFKQETAILEEDQFNDFYANPKSHVYTTRSESMAMVVSSAVNTDLALGGLVSTGKGAKPKAGFVGFSTSHLRIPAFHQPWEVAYGKPKEMLSPLDIILEAPIHIAKFNNAFGCPNVGGYFRTYEQIFFEQDKKQMAFAYHQPMLEISSIGCIREATRLKSTQLSEIAIVLIGDGQRENAEMQRRCLEVIQTCASLGTENPILQIQFSPEKLWGNGLVWYVMTVNPKRLDVLKNIALRECCPCSVIDQMVFKPKEKFIQKQVPEPFLTLPEIHFLPMTLRHIRLEEAIFRLLRFPCIADKSFLITIHDRTISGLVARDPMVGPWQVPVADCAIIARGFDFYTGEAIANGERAPLAIINPAASVRMAIGEAITNIAGAYIGALSEIRLSASWRGVFQEDVQAIGLELCTALGVTISLNQHLNASETIWYGDGQKKQVITPPSVLINAFAPVMDVRHTLTPVLLDDTETLLIFLDLSGGQQRLGASALAQVFNQMGHETPDVDDPVLLKSFFSVIQQLHLEGKILAYHDRSDGGLFVTLCEMAFASHVGLKIDISDLGFDPLSSLFNEELGAVIQIRSEDIESVLAALGADGISNGYIIGTLDETDQISIVFNKEVLCTYARIVLQKTWSETSFHVQALRDNPRCAKKQFEAINNPEDPGLNVDLTFDLTEDITLPFINLGARPRIAILREQGTYGHVEMAAAFDRAQFECVDIHMSDLQNKNSSLSEFKGLAICGGFSFGDVLGAGLGWAKRILFTPLLKDQFEAFFINPETFTLGIANGCQMLSGLKSIVPGADLWPSLTQNYSEQFESRLCLVEIQSSPAILLQGMEGSRLPVPVAHKEGRVLFGSETEEEEALKKGLVAVRYVDNWGRKTKTYPANPDGSPLGITGLTTPDGRVLCMMPHPDRAFRTVQYSWHPDNWGTNGPWLRLFQNARKWIG